jgi:hypothetical protein
MVTAVAVIVLPAVLPAQPESAYPLPDLPPNSWDVFTPIMGFPRDPVPGLPGDPGPPPTDCPMLRQTGVFAFTDSMGTPDPNDDREYFVACRSDGIHLIDATPKFNTFVTSVYIPAANKVTFTEELGWGYLGPVPPNAPPGGQGSMDPGMYLFLNAINPALLPNNPYQPSQAYCNYTPPQGPWGSPFPGACPYSTRDTTNREAVAWYDAPADRWFLFSVSRLRTGIWVIPLRRTSGTGWVLEPDPGPPPGVMSGWWAGDPQNPLRFGYKFYLDAERSQLWVTEEPRDGTYGVGHVRGIQITSGGNLQAPYLLDYVGTDPVTTAQMPPTTPCRWATSCSPASTTPPLQSSTSSSCRFRTRTKHRLRGSTARPRRSLGAEAPTESTMTTAWRRLRRSGR